ncbi:MAG: holo-ACP synthase [Clostridia bacterium]|nr:holo-ACP synthase [Clostridia bacterium]
MKIKCGTDIIEITRIKDSIDTIGEKFVERVFTPNEIQYCESKEKQKYQHYAGRFAAKEAAFKAVSESLNDKYALSWKDVEVINDNNGKPHITINKINIDLIENIDISISHCKEYACANVVVLYK